MVVTYDGNKVSQTSLSPSLEFCPVGPFLHLCSTTLISSQVLLGCVRGWGQFRDWK